MTAPSNAEVATRSASNRAFDGRTGPKRVPRSPPDHQRQASRLPRQRGERAKTAARHRRHCRVLRATTIRTSTAASTSCRSAPPTRTRARRLKVQAFMGAASEREVIFVRGTTEGINLVAQSYGQANVGEGDEVLITTMEHHSNIVPWQMLCERSGATLKVVPINDRGELEMDELKKLLGDKTKIVAVGHVSNALGTINPIRTIIELAPRARCSRSRGRRPGRSSRRHRRDRARL